MIGRNSKRLFSAGDLVVSGFLCAYLLRINKRPSLLKNPSGDDERKLTRKREGMRLTREWNVQCNGEGGGTRILMGFKERTFAPLVAVSLEELVPQDHFDRHVQQVLDLSFVYDLVRDCYSTAGRPSVDPVVFFKLQLVMFFEDIRSERLLMRQVADRLSVRWYVGYDLDEPLPDHSTLSKIRLRYGLSVFRCFFEAIVEQCQQAKLVWGRELYFDSSAASTPMPIWIPWSRALQ